MKKQLAYDYREEYRKHKIFIHRMQREWWWIVLISSKSRNSPIGYYSFDTALNKARRFIDTKVV